MSPAGPANPVGTAAAADRRYVEEVLELLWPGHRRTDGSRRSRARSGRGDLLMVPPGRPRLVLPRRPGRVAAAALRNYNTAGAGVRRGRLAISVLALRCGAGSLVPGGLRCEDDEVEEIEAELSAVLGRRVYVGLYLGPPRVVQKPVLQVLDERGRTFAFAKVGVNEHTTGLLEHECATLHAMAAASTPRLRAPAVLYEGSWRGHRLSVQERLGGTRRPVDPELRMAAGRELHTVGGTVRRPLADSAFAGRLLERVSWLPDTAVGNRLREAADRAFDRTGEVELVFGAAHGDWVPWNMATDGNRLEVWDWEGFESDVPLGFDELHWRVNHAVAITGQDPHTAVRTEVGSAVAPLAHELGGEDRVRVTALWYVLDLATRYAVDGEDAVGGTPLSRLGSWLVPTLGRLLDGADEDAPR